MPKISLRTTNPGIWTEMGEILSYQPSFQAHGAVDPKTEKLSVQLWKSRDI